MSKFCYILRRFVSIFCDRMIITAGKRDILLEFEKCIDKM